jgi:hypothetical protein
MILIFGIISALAFTVGYCCAVPFERRNAPHKFKPTEVHPSIHRATDWFVDTFFKVREK